MDDQEIENFVERYYEAPDPVRAIKGLQTYLAEAESLMCGEEVLMPYRFGRLAQLHPEVAPTFRHAIETLGGTKPDFCSALGEWLNEDRPSPKNILDRVIQSPIDNDLLWTEFSLTGEPAPLIRLIDLFERSDKIRVEMEEWLSTPDSFVGLLLQRRRRTCERFADILDVHVDTAAGTICSEDDLDALCFMRGDVLIDKKQMVEMGRFFPIGLSEEEVTYCVTKATAKWSLYWSAIKNKRILSIVTDQISERSGRALLVVLEIAARASLTKGDQVAAGRYLERFLTLNPSRSELHALRAPLIADVVMAGLSTLSEEAVEVPSFLSSKDVRDIVRLCVANEQSVKSGYGMMNAGIRKGDFEDAKDQKFIELTYKFDGYGSFEVVQWMDPEDWDKWVTKDGRTYQSVGFWFEISDAEIKRTREWVNWMLRDAGWVEELKFNSPDSFDEYEWRDNRFLLLKYHSLQLHGLIERLLPVKSTSKQALADIDVWISLQSQRMVACDAFVKNAVVNQEVAHLYLRQVFAMPNGIVTIEHPEVMVAPPGSGLEPGTEVTMHAVPSRSKIFEPK